MPQLHIAVCIYRASPTRGIRLNFLSNFKLQHSRCFASISPSTHIFPSMPKAAFYAVQKGISPGIYLTWWELSQALTLCIKHIFRAECEQQIKGYSGAVYKKFGTLADAESFCHPSSSSTRSNPIAQPTESQKATAPKAALANVTDETQWTVVYTDGACPGNGQPGSKAGVGVWWGDMDPRYVNTLRTLCLFEGFDQQFDTGISPSAVQEIKQIIEQN